MRERQHQERSNATLTMPMEGNKSSTIQPSIVTDNGVHQEEVLLGWGYTVEKTMYAVAIIVGSVAAIYTIRRYIRNWNTNFEIAARLLSYKISLTVADALVLFLYAPTQLVWISTFWWYGGDPMCRTYKFLSTFAFHLTGNMQLIISIDRLYIMTRINRMTMKRRVDYNSNRVLAFAWGFAIACALPQLFIFSVRSSFTGKPQCVSLWVTERLAYQENIDYINYYDSFLEAVKRKDDLVVFSNGTLKVIEPTKPEFTYDQVEKSYQNMQKLEQIYNYCHLVTMIVVPYLGELIMYTIILSLLKYAKQGDFMGLRQLLRLRERRAEAHKKKAGRKSVISDLEKHKRSSGRRVTLIVPDDTCEKVRLTIQPDTDEPTRNNRRFLKADTSTTSLRKGRLISILKKKQINDSSALHYDALSTEAPSNLTYRSSVSNSYGNLCSLDIQKKTSLEQRQSSSEPELTAISCPTVQKHQLRLPAEDENRRTVFNDELQSMKIRRASAPCPGESHHKSEPSEEPRPHNPWVRTVTKARKNTKKKAFYMLALNLIFWLPYCAHSIISSVTIFENFQNYQFVQALTCFNAITNILL